VTHANSPSALLPVRSGADDKARSHAAPQRFGDALVDAAGDRKRLILLHQKMSLK